jgi:hypothetical protein
MSMFIVEYLALSILRLLGCARAWPLCSRGEADFPNRINTPTQCRKKGIAKMIASLFTWNRVRLCQIQAPLRKERERYLLALLNQGISKPRVRTIATVDGAPYLWAASTLFRPPRLAA